MNTGAAGVFFPSFRSFPKRLWAYARKQRQREAKERKEAQEKREREREDLRKMLKHLAQHDLREKAGGPASSSSSNATHNLSSTSSESLRKEFTASKGRGRSAAPCDQEHPQRFLNSRAPRSIFFLASCAVLAHAPPASLQWGAPCKALKQECRSAKTLWPSG